MVKINTWEIVKASIIAILSCNPTFHFKYDVKDKCVKLLIDVIGHIMYTDAISDISSRKMGTGVCRSIVFV